nr:CRISPR-associated endoribonuclease Cas6 [Candidatus Freyarchaeota archaeon]
MRLMLSLVSDMDIAYDMITKHTVQGFVYNALRGTEYESKHDQSGFKFFTFSDIFPSSRTIEKSDVKHLIVSSPDVEFIKTLREKFDNVIDVKFGPYKFNLLKVRMFRLEISREYISGSPIVLYRSNYDGVYFSFRRDGDLDFFLSRLRDNAVKKFNSYYGVDFRLEGSIFDRIVFRKEVALPITLKTRRFIIIGSLWEELAKVGYTKEERKFYSFLMECGLGEKNSLGFGFINPKIRGNGKN